MTLSLAAVPHPSARVATLLALIAGALVPLAFAPFDLWPLAISALLTLALLLHRQRGLSALWRALWFGIGLYGVGVFWVFVSIHVPGNASVPLRALMTGAFEIGRAHV